MLDEYSNYKGSDINPQAENKSVNENFAALENKPVVENVPIKENLSDDHKRSEGHKLNMDKRNRAMSMLSTGLAATIGLVLAGITNFVNVKMKASFVDEATKYDAGVLSYSINVEEMTEDETLTIYVTRDNVRTETISLVDEDGDGVISGSIPGVKEYVDEVFAAKDNAEVNYLLELKGVVGLGVERSFDAYRTTITKRSAIFDSVEGECHCDEDSCFHFTMKFDDQSGVFSDFVAYIEDDFGNKSYCEFTSDLHEEQKIYVLSPKLQGSHGYLVVKYKADDGVENGTGDKDKEGYYIHKTEINM